MEHSVAIAPVEVSVSVAAAPQRAFEVFTKEIGSWWPVATHSIEEDQAVSAEMECREGGRIFEKHRDGTEADWGIVTVWEPPKRLVFSWNPSYEDRPYTEVRVTFTEVEDGTRVDLEHHGWDRLGEAGKDLREGYVTGWSHLLGDLYARSFA